MSNSTDRSLRELNDCGCCEGVDAVTPVEVKNRPGLSAIAYRVGTHSRFKESMLAALSDGERPLLGNLKTREDDDFSIALLDAWAMVADVLTFYQERIANESYLRTATERRSIIELARAIGYELNPGVAASTYLAFTLEDAPGSPKEATIDKGTREQSIPGPGEKPQVYETVEKIEAKAEYNRLKPIQSELQMPGFGSRQIYLEGVATNLKPGHPLLFVGLERAVEGPQSERWDFRRVYSVEPDADANRTLVRWLEPLGSLIPRVEPAKTDLKIYAMRLQASLFGHNAPDWRALPVALRVGEPYLGPPTSPPTTFLKGVFADRQNSWAEKKFDPGTKIINLDAVYSQIVRDSWVVLTKPEESVTGISDDGRTTLETTIPAYVELYRVRAVGEETKADFNISAKSSRLTISGENIELFSPRLASVYAQSEELPIAEAPVIKPVYGEEIVLETVVEGLEADKKLIIRGRRPRVEIAERAFDLLMIPVGIGRRVRRLKPGEIFFLLELPTPVDPQDEASESNKLKRWRLLDQMGAEGFVTGTEKQLLFTKAEEEDEPLSELVTLKKAERLDEHHTKLILNDPLKNIYDRSDAELYANVALATHGESTSEVLGSGDGSRSYQRFTLQKAPLTYTGADTPSGGETTLEVRVNDLKWTEVPALFGHGPNEQIYTTLIDDGGVTTVQFGDGHTGARLPTGQENVRASYRKGIGREGLVKADQISLLMTRPLGVKGVRNPMPPSGAQDPQSLADARSNAPVTVLTLGRIVSLQDYEDFASSYSGIAKALVTWTWNRHARGVFVTVAGPFGDEVPDDSSLHKSLVSAMHKAGDSQVPIEVKSYHKVFFKVAAQIMVDTAFLPERVLADVKSALSSSFSFEARSFGQPVTLSEVMTIIQNVKGVVSVDVNSLYRSDSTAGLESYLKASAPQPGDDATKAAAAELLIIDPESLEDLEVIA